MFICLFVVIYPLATIVGIVGIPGTVITIIYRASAVGWEHSRSIHPLTLLMVSDLISEIFGETFQSFVFARSRSR